MHSFQRFLAVMLVCSLVSSDLMTFWHLGNCGCPESCAAVCRHDDATNACDDACGHSDNPFAKRKAKGAIGKPQAAASDQANRDQANSLTSSSNACRDSAHQSTPDSSSSEPDSSRGSEHDSDDCSICRWLVTARNPQVFSRPSVLMELAPLETSDSLTWPIPTLEPLFEELSRRGPPVPPAFA